MRMIIYLCLLFFALSCEKRQILSSKPIVLVSVPSYLYFVKRIAGDTVAAISLVPPGANPHIFEPTPKEVQQFRKAVLWIRLNEPSEQKTYTVLKEQSNSMRIVDMTETMALLPLYQGEHNRDKTHFHRCNHQDGNDLHIWLSPRRAQQQAEIITRHLCELFPHHKEKYLAALASFLSDLKTLDEEISSLLAFKSNSAILVSHPAFAYFCQDYHLTQLSIEIEGKEPLPQDVTRILKMAKEYKIANIIVEPQYNNKGAQLIAEHLALPIHVIDPYSEDYLKNLRWIAEVVAK